MNRVSDMNKTGYIVDVSSIDQLDSSILRQQIIPIQQYFIFSALSTIKGSVILKKDNTVALLDDYATCLRYQFRCIQTMENMSFLDECAFLKAFLALEKMKGQGLHVEYQVEEENFAIPPMSMVLLVQKAMLQSLSAETHEVRITGKKQNEDYLLEIWNSASDTPGTLESQIEKVRDVVAAWWRLQGNATVTWERQNDSVLLQVKIPL